MPIIDIEYIFTGVLYVTDDVHVYRVLYSKRGRTTTSALLRERTTRTRNSFPCMEKLAVPSM